MNVSVLFLTLIALMCLRVPIAVALGLKVGKIGGISELDNKLASTKDSQEDNLINP